MELHTNENGWPVGRVVIFVNDLTLTRHLKNKHFITKIYCDFLKFFHQSVFFMIGILLFVPCIHIKFNCNDVKCLIYSIINSRLN